MDDADGLAEQVDVVVASRKDCVPIRRGDVRGGRRRWPSRPREQAAAIEVRRTPRRAAEKSPIEPVVQAALARRRRAITDLVAFQYPVAADVLFARAASASAGRVRGRAAVAILEPEAGSRLGAGDATV